MEPFLRLEIAMEGMTEVQQNYIDKCKAVGYGWAKFAKSVEAQGFCSPKQEATLERMVWKITRHPNYTTRDSDHDISDEEAGMSGDFF